MQPFRSIAGWNNNRYWTICMWRWHDLGRQRRYLPPVKTCSVCDVEDGAFYRMRKSTVLWDWLLRKINVSDPCGEECVQRLWPTPKHASGREEQRKGLQDGFVETQPHDELLSRRP